MTFPDWTGAAAYIVAAGQSALDIVPNIPRGRCKVLAVNRSHELVPWADALYAADTGFWRHYAAARRFPGLKYCPEDSVTRFASDVIPVTIPHDQRTGNRVSEMLRETVGVIGSGGNSGFQALNLAIQFGANPIFLVGYDYGGKHWHPDHSAQLRNPSQHQFKTWVRLLDAEAERLKNWGYTVINLSPVSALKAFPHGDGRLPYPHATSLPA